MNVSIAEPSMNAAAPGWQAELALGFISETIDGEARTTLSHRRHLGPLRVQRPFYPDGPVCNVYIVHPPGGIVGGDRLELQVKAHPGAHALLTTPAAGKFYRSAGPEAEQRVEIRACNATIEWLPQETIYYPGAAVRQQTVIRLDGQSRFIGWDIGCYGLASRGERFSSGQIRQDFELWRDDRPLLLDHLRLAGDGPAFGSAWGLAGHPVLGTFVACPATAADVDAARDAATGLADVTVGLSLVDGVIVGRVLAMQADAAMRAWLAIWRVLRPRLLQRDVVLPRIWAT